jgi:hypothetical protein
MQSGLLIESVKPDLYKITILRSKQELMFANSLSVVKFVELALVEQMERAWELTTKKGE